MIKKKLHLVKWDKLAKPKNQGSLGIANLNLRNTAMLSKWVPKWYNEGDRSWKKWMLEKYHPLSGLSFTKSFINCNNSFVLLNILLALNNSRVSSFGNNILKMEVTDFHRKIGDGKSILFWFDLWTEEGQMVKLFPKLCALSSHKGISLKDFVLMTHQFTNVETSSLWK